MVFAHQAEKESRDLRNVRWIEERSSWRKAIAAPGGRK